MISSTSMNKSSKNFSQPFDHSFKILLIGNSGVGKSSVLMQFSQQKFIANYFTTIGVDYVHLELNQENQIYKNKRFEYQNANSKNLFTKWDTAGQDRFKTITSSYYRGANGIIIVYDITDRNSFQSVTHWLTEIDKLTDQKTKKYLIGNKVDLEEKRQVTFFQGKQLAKKINIPFRQTSARSANGISEIFQQLGQIILGYGNNSTQTKPTEQFTPSINNKEDNNIKKLINQKKEKKEQGCC